MHVAEEIRRWRQARRMTPGLPPSSTASRIAVSDHEVVVIRRRTLRLSERPRADRSSPVGQ
jgi:hypothetical protein